MQNILSPVAIMLQFLLYNNVALNSEIYLIIEQGIL